MVNVPKGFWFHPTNQELIEYYMNLKNKGVKGAADVLKLVAEYDQYGDTEPWKIFKDHGGADLCNQDLYFLTKQKSIQGRKQISQTIGTGIWSMMEPRSTIFIARKKIGFRHKTKSSVQTLQNACWYMKEYSTEANISSDYVICRLRENRKPGACSVGNTDFPDIPVPTSIDSAAPIPVGFRFHPTDEELICQFLRNKMRVKGGRGLAMFKGEVADPDPVVPVVVEKQMRKKDKGKEGVMQVPSCGYRST